MTILWQRHMSTSTHAMILELPDRINSGARRLIKTIDHDGLQLTLQKDDQRSLSDLKPPRLRRALLDSVLLHFLTTFAIIFSCERALDRRRRF